MSITICKITGCNRQRYNKATQLCITHHRRLETGKEVCAPIKAIAARGTGTIARGYRQVQAPIGHLNANSQGRILEHRLVMSNHLNRPLHEGEEVHHKNGDRLDNRLENLELWSHSQPPGQRIEDKLQWAKQLIEQYQPPIENDWNENYRPSLWG